ncbi:uridine kinase [Blastococcus sp. Marseille-P5729]|uniref:uridine kinase family protein n=1 Tax=Blastococcus sp. Marseille-P5729 TaxID=2086582 RepID=UPI000D100281|nr:hypothetical protein [Blastococcus sp. Marseille-P5729]
MPVYDLNSISEQIRQRRPQAGALVVAVDGRSGSGKSRLARRLGRALGKFTMLRMDHVVPGWDGLEESVRLIRPALEALRSGEPARYRTWDWLRGDWGQPLHRPAAPTVVIEGCGSGARSLADLVDYLVWVDVPAEIRYERAMARDGASYAGHWEQWARQEEAHYAVNATVSRADLVIDGRLPVR